MLQNVHCLSDYDDNDDDDANDDNDNSNDSDNNNKNIRSSHPGIDKQTNACFLNRSKLCIFFFLLLEPILAF